MGGIFKNGSEMTDDAVAGYASTIVRVSPEIT
jgi:hypothetical protein